jgi:hypothetical protein
LKTRKENAFDEATHTVMCAAVAALLSPSMVEERPKDLKQDEEECYVPAYTMLATCIARGASHAAKA